GQREKGQSVLPCPSVYSPAPALGSLSSVALSSVQVPLTLAQTRAASANYCPVLDKLSSGFLVEATNHVSSGFLREATGELAPWATSIIGPLVTRVVCSHPQSNAWIAKDADKC